MNRTARRASGWRRTWLAAAAAAGLAAAFAGFGPTARAEGLKDGDTVAVVGDSITEQKQYSVFVETYLLACQPAKGLKATQFGWGGETAPGFLSRMNNDFAPFKATVATTCYGMNDGGYSPMDEAKAKRYRDAQTAVVKRMKEQGVRFIVVGSPGVVDSDTFRRDAKNPKAAGEMSAMYNKTLGELREIARDVARKEGVAFADVYGAMMDAMPKAKAKYGPQYHVGGGDGVHPDANGHLLMAYAFLKGLGVDGNVGTITVDLASNKAEATDGHKVLNLTGASAGKGGAVEVESTRYPFCFSGADPKSTSSTLGVLEFVPFNQDLNRFTLVVTGLKGDKAKVTWGTATKEFAAADLAKGVNLAAEFATENPFSAPFKAVQSAVQKKQAFETPMIKSFLHGLPEYERMLPEEKDAFAKLKAAMAAKYKPMQDETAAAVKPVKHTIKIEG